VRHGDPAITQATMIEAIDRVVSGPASNTHHLITEHERWIVAIHEASHAVVTRATGATVSSQKVSIVSRGRKMGTAATEMTDKEQVIMQKADMNRQLCVLMGGLAGEQLAFGTTSTGVGEDLHAATQFARRMVTSFGMSEEIGLMTVGEQGGEVFLGASLQELGNVGPTTLDTIDNEVQRLVAHATENASLVLRPNWASVEELANALVEHETLAGVGLEAMLAGVRRVEIEGMPSVFEESQGDSGSHPRDGGA
jgi:cell division protease FtsH